MDEQCVHRGIILSASRRTDIPAFYAKWFINRVREGYCTVPNPFNLRQVTKISLKPEDVAVIVFWTRNPRPLMPFLDELDERGFRYYFQYTVMDNPKELDPKSPSLTSAISTFKELSQRVGAKRVIWRYDPIVLTKKTSAEFHVERHALIAQSLRGYTYRNVISIVDAYNKVTRQVKKLPIDLQPSEEPDYGFVRQLADNSERNGMEIVSCAEDIDLHPYGIRPGKCIDDELIKEVFGIEVSHKKDPNQRKACGCVVSKDIGMYDTCLFGCVYCYATQSFERAKKRHAEHDPHSPSLIGWYEPPQDQEQLSLSLDTVSEEG